MDEFQLACIPTSHLKLLRENIRKELQRRREADKVQRRVNLASSLKVKTHDDLVGANSLIYEHNSSSLRSIPKIDKTSPRDNIRYLPCLIEQDWSHIYNGGSIENKFYVYAHVDPRSYIFVATENAGGNYGGKPFYIGKGTGNRAFDLKRNQGHGATIKEIISDGYSPESIVKILFSDLTEAKALEIEAKLIYYFGTMCQSNRANGWLVNLEISEAPEFISVMERFIPKSKINNQGAL